MLSDPTVGELIVAVVVIVSMATIIVALIAEGITLLTNKLRGNRMSAHEPAASEIVRDMYYIIHNPKKGYLAECVWDRWDCWEDDVELAHRFDNYVDAAQVVLLLPGKKENHLYRVVVTKRISYNKQKVEANNDS